MGNEHLQDVNFWIDAEGAELQELIDKLSAIEKPTKGERNKLAKAKYHLTQVEREAERLAALNKKWQTGSPVDTSTAAIEIDADLFGDGNEIVLKPEYPVCSFCKGKLEMITATRGTGKVKVNRVTDPVVDGDDIIIVERLAIQAEKVAACPKCAHLVKNPVIASRV